MIIAFSLQHFGSRFVMCKHDGHIGAGWGVTSMVGILVFMSHVMPAMFCCAMPRYVFIKNVEGGFLDQLMADAGHGGIEDEFGKAGHTEAIRSREGSFTGSVVYDNMAGIPLRKGSINTSFTSS